jgi:hypothetical protein
VTAVVTRSFFTRRVFSIAVLLEFLRENGIPSAQQRALMGRCSGKIANALACVAALERSDGAQWLRIGIPAVPDRRCNAGKSHHDNAVVPALRTDGFANDSLSLKAV